MPTGTWKSTQKIINHKGNVNQTTMRYHFTAIRIAIIKKTGDNKHWQGCEKREPLCTVGAILIVMENNMYYPIKLRTIRLSNNSTSGNISDGNENS